MTKFAGFLLLLLLVGGVALWRRASGASAPGNANFPVSYSESEWKARLSPQAYKILRQEATEAPNASPLNHEKRDGVFVCAGCDGPLFVSTDKFDSGTGWPSFSRPGTNEAVGSTTDYKLIMARTEVHCARCGGHLGHVFSDGPPPTGQRYCINGQALGFKPTEGAENAAPITSGVQRS